MTSNSTTPGPALSEVAREWVLPAAIAILGLVLRLERFNYFLVPDSDFFSLRETAVALMHGDAPPSFQRLPFYSLLMGGLAPLFRGHDPFLLAAESVNLAAFALATFVLYRLSARFVGDAAWIVALLFAMDPLAFHMTLQPRTELPTVALAILACYLATRRPAAAYVCAGLASLTRYEGAFLIPAVLLRDLAFGPRRWRACALAAAASIGLTGWCWLNLRATGHLNPYFTYFGGTLSAAGSAFVQVLVKACLGSVGLTLAGKTSTIAGVMLGALIIGGLVSMLRTSARDGLPITAFFAMTLALNLAFFAPTPEHAFIIVWVCELAVVAALVAIARVIMAAAGPSDDSKRHNRGIGVVLGAGVLLAFLVLFWSAHRSGSGIPTNGLAVTVVAISAILATSRPRGMPTAGLLAAAMATLPIVVQGDLAAVRARLDSATNIKAELRLAGEWFTAHAGPSQRMAVTEPWVVAAYAGPQSPEAFVATQTLTAASPGELAAELRQLGVDYVLWDSSHGRLPPTDFYFRKYRVDLLSELRDGRSSPDFELLGTLGAGSHQAYLYRLRR